MVANRFMSIFRRIVSRVLPVFFYLVCTTGYTQQKDAAVWMFIDLDKKINKDLYIHAKEQFRLNENYSHADYAYIDLGLDYDLNKVVSFTTAYCFNFKNQVNAGNAWTLRGQWYGSITFAAKVGELKITDRNQIQTDIEDTRNSESSWFYRNKLGLHYKFSKDWAGYGTIELYRRLSSIPEEEDILYRTRYAAGIKYRISKKQDIEFGYLIQRQVKKSQPDWIYAITIGFSQTFK